MFDHKNIRGMHVKNFREKINKRMVVSKGATNLNSSNHPNKPRPDKKHLSNVSCEITRLEFPQKGSFNPGIIRLNDNRLVMVYRPNEESFIGCLLNNDLSVVPLSFHQFKINNCADPRLVWLPDNRLLMVYSSIDHVGIARECIRGNIIMNSNDGKFIDTDSFRISPESMTSRQKNWMPFVHKNIVYLIGTINPHTIYELDPNFNCRLVYTNGWSCPWPIKEHLRGNTNPVKMPDGNYLATFHTSTWTNDICHYDNGIYVFSGEPPFKVLKCAKRTYLPAEAAIEKHYRKANIILCTFPVGMILENDKVLISYGDNDSVVKIAKYKLNDLLNTTVEVC